MDQLTVILTLPPRELSPNWRGHFMAKARAVRKYRQQAWGEAMFQIQQAQGSVPWWKNATLKATFWFSDLRRRDRDNLLASLKPAFDGLADAHVVVNDSCITYLPVEIGLDRANPRVELEVCSAS